MSNELTAIGPVGNYASKHTAKRDKHTIDDQPGYCQIREGSPGLHPGGFWAISPGLDRFGADCLRWLSVRRNFDGSFESFKSLVEKCNEKMKHKASFEGLRLLLPFIVPFIVFFLGKELLGEYYRHQSFGGFGVTISEELVKQQVYSKIVLLFLGSLLVGQWLHRNISKAIAKTIPPEAILLTTYMTRHNLSMEDIEKNPGLIEGALHASTCVSLALQDQTMRMAKKSMGEYERRLDKFLIPLQRTYSSAPIWQDLIKIYNSYVAVYRQGNRSGAYFDSSSSYSGMDSSGFPQYNVNGMPMIANSGIDITGHTYGTTDQF